MDTIKEQGRSPGLYDEQLQRQQQERLLRRGVPPPQAFFTVRSEPDIADQQEEQG